VKRLLKQLFLLQREKGRPPGHSVAIPRNILASIIATGAEGILIPVLVEFFGVYYLYAVMAGMFLATTISFFLNKYWVFEARRGRKTWQYVKQIILGAGSFAGNTTIIWALTDKVGLHYYVSFIISTTTMFFCWNYPGGRWFVFSDGHRKRKTGSVPEASAAPSAVKQSRTQAPREERP
jgi:putative flippase GtrA